MTTTGTFKRSLPPRLEELPGVRADLRRWLSELDVPRPIADDIVLAAWELCANAIAHPRRAGAQEVVVEGRTLSQGIRIAVRDPGTWTGTACSRPRDGLGLRIVEGLVNRLAIKRGLGETEIVLFRGTKQR